MFREDGDDWANAANPKNGRGIPRENAEQVPKTVQQGIF